ncbi:hypothetical protein [Burkholderia pseudomallei]
MLDMTARRPSHAAPESCTARAEPTIRPAGHLQMTITDIHI